MTTPDERAAIIARLRQLSHAVVEGPEVIRRECTMRVPAEPLRDADLVLSTAANMLEAALSETVVGPAAPSTTPTPVPVAERPWERDGWCDADGRCWFYRPAEIPCRLANGTMCRWVLDTPDPDGEPVHDTHSLPFHALPLPAAPGEGAS